MKIHSAALTLIILSSFLSANKSIEIDISQQRLYVYEDKLMLASYPISSSSFGEGQIENSYKTPLGKHKILTKIGTNVEKNTIFVSRENMNQVAEIVHERHNNENDFVTSRILWLDGLEEGHNKGGNVDSFKRYIYIHGTHEEGLIGEKASHGCIRMFNNDVIELFSYIPEETEVNIKI